MSRPVNKGRSPRARGRPARRSVIADVSGRSPRAAGDAERPWRRAAKAVDPRVRGETLGSDACTCTVDPRVRGETSRGALLASAGGSIRVRGETPCRRRHRCGCRVDPRARGSSTAREQRVSLADPRVRGGDGSSRLIVRRSMGRSPRARETVPSLRQALGTARGRSSRARGDRHPGRSPRARGRSSPRCAGDPRVRGETSDARSRGRSPRARGDLRGSERPRVDPRVRGETRQRRLTGRSRVRGGDSGSRIAVDPRAGDPTVARREVDPARGPPTLMPSSRGRSRVRGETRQDGRRGTGGRSSRAGETWSVRAAVDPRVRSGAAPRAGDQADPRVRGGDGRRRRAGPSFFFGDSSSSRRSTFEWQRTLNEKTESSKQLFLWNAMPAMKAL